MALQVAIITLTAVLMFLGLVGSILPLLPGSPLILLGAFIYAWYTDFTSVTWGTLGILVILTLLSQALEYLASLLGAKKFGASRWGMVGAFLGGVLGIFFGGVLGILIGPFLGALFLELLRGQELNASLKIGFGTLVGFLGGTLGKLVIAISMIGIFLVRVLG